MEILRVPPYPLTVTWDVPAPNTDYVVYLEDLVDHSFDNVPLTSNASSKITYQIPSTNLDLELLVRIIDADTEALVFEDQLNVVRPYVDPNILATTPSELIEFKMYELVARSIIDNVIEQGFYNKKAVIQKSGDGADYFSLWYKTNKILKAYENDVLVYDADNTEDNLYTYKITLDDSAVYRVETDSDSYNRAEHMPIRIPRAAGDLVDSGYRLVAFPSGYDYSFIVDSGYKAVPADIERATIMLINDLKCGRLNYYQKYITSYDTDQFKIEMDKRMLNGTGNLIVDNILDKYKALRKPGVI